MNASRATIGDRGAHAGRDRRRRPARRTRPPGRRPRRAPGTSTKPTTHESIAAGRWSSSRRRGRTRGRRTRSTCRSAATRGRSAATRPSDADHGGIVTVSFALHRPLGPLDHPAERAVVQHREPDREQHEDPEPAAALASEAQRQQDRDEQHPGEVERAERQRDARVGRRSAGCPPRRASSARPTTGQMPPGTYLPISPTKYQVTQATQRRLDADERERVAPGHRDRRASRARRTSERRPPATPAPRRRSTSGRCPTDGRSPGRRTRRPRRRSRCRSRSRSSPGVPASVSVSSERRSGRASRLSRPGVSCPTPSVGSSPASRACAAALPPPSPCSSIETGEKLMAGTKKSRSASGSDGPGAKRAAEAEGRRGGEDGGEAGPAVAEPGGGPGRVLGPGRAARARVGSPARVAARCGRPGRTAGRRRCRSRSGSRRRGSRSSTRAPTSSWSARCGGASSAPRSAGAATRVDVEAVFIGRAGQRRQLDAALRRTQETLDVLLALSRVRVR